MAKPFDGAEPNIDQISAAGAMSPLLPSLFSQILSAEHNNLKDKHVEQAAFDVTITKLPSLMTLSFFLFIPTCTPIVI